LNENGIEPIQRVNDLVEQWPDLHKYFLRWQKRFPFTQTFTVTINPTSVSANTTSEQTVTIMGLTMNDIVSVNKPTHTAGFGVVGFRVSALNTLAITFANVTASPIDAPSENYFVMSVRR
jgi:hypothetical protein